MENQARLAITSQLHISFSQIFSYLSCSIKYQFRYVVCRQPERISLALPFGSALHKSLERYYRSLPEGRKEKLDILQELFSEILTLELSDKKDQIVYNKDCPDADGAIAMGNAMLEAFYVNTDLEDHQIVAVELPMSASLYTDAGQPTEFKLVGFIDLLLKDPKGDYVVVDHKTAARAKTQADVDADLQMTVYSYLLSANRYVFPTAPVKCRFDVLRKLKTPKLEHYHSTRSADDRKRLAKIATCVLAGIEAGVFIPNRGWMYNDCEFSNACANWHR